MKKITDIEQKSFKELFVERFGEELGNKLITEIKLGIEKIINMEETPVDLKKRLLQLALPSLSSENIKDFLDITIYADILIKAGIMKI